MKVYIEGKLSADMDTFIPEELWFSTEDCEDNTVVSESCFCLSGEYCESSVHDDITFSCRWKGAELSYIKDGKRIDTEDFKIDDVFKMMEEKNMRITNISAYYDDTVYVQLTNISIEDGNISKEFDMELVDDEFEMIGD